MASLLRQDRDRRAVSRQDEEEGPLPGKIGHLVVRSEGEEIRSGEQQGVQPMRAHDLAQAPMPVITNHSRQRLHHCPHLSVTPLQSTRRQRATRAEAWQALPPATYAADWC